MSRFVMRIDDVTPGMAWSKFQLLEDALRTTGVPALIGVVPECRDPALSVEPARNDFWDRVREWQSVGWAVAQHGYTHEYDTTDGGLLKINSKSEFAGHSYREQSSRLERGKRLLEGQRVWTPIFMAPGHSFDHTTLRALADLGFKYVTDGYGLYPFELGGLTLLPQMFARPLHVGIGVYTICVHVNRASEGDLRSLADFVERNSHLFIDFDSAVKMRPSSRVGAVVSRTAAVTVPSARRAKRLARRR